jgi:hypothetical protein
MSLTFSGLSHPLCKTQAVASSSSWYCISGTTHLLLKGCWDPIVLPWRERGSPWKALEKQALGLALLAKTYSQALIPNYEHSFGNKVYLMMMIMQMIKHNVFELVYRSRMKS